VIQEGREIGTVHFVPSPGSVISVGGIFRLVKSIDGLRREIWVAETETGGSGKLWRGSRGVIHPRISGMVKSILTETNLPAYLSPAARPVLEQGRRRARALGLLERPLLPVDGGFLIAPWLGSAGMRTLETLLKQQELKRSLKISYLDWESDFTLLAETTLPMEAFTAGLARACGQPAESAKLLPETIPYTDKYDYLLPQALLEKQYAANMLDPEALTDFVRQLA